MNFGISSKMGEAACTRASFEWLGILGHSLKRRNKVLSKEANCNQFCNNPLPLKTPICHGSMQLPVLLFLVELNFDPIEIALGFLK